MQNGKIRVYGCGGAGINTVGVFAKTTPSVGYAEIKTTFIDTSRSNLNDSNVDENTYLLPNVDGSGKKRAENHVGIGEAIKDILVKHKPESFNVVVSSASGGSGSIINSLLVKELLERGHTTVVILVGSSESAITCNNTLKTIKTFDAISRSTGKPVVLSYEHNRPDVKRSAVDTHVRKVISSLAALCASDNRELDSCDLDTWVNYHTACPVEPQLVELVIADSPKDVDNLSNIVSLASLLRDPDVEMPKVLPDYSTVGYTACDDKDFKDKHFAILLDGMTDIYKNLTKLTAEYEELSASRDTRRKSYVDKDDDLTDDCLVL